MNKVTNEKIKSMKDNGESIGCIACLSTVDDGKHEYDKSIDMFYCPSLDE